MDDSVPNPRQPGSPGNHTRKKEERVTPASPNVAPRSSARKEKIVLVEDTDLRRLRARPPFPQYLAQLWDRRHFISAEARSKALSSGRGTFLGKLWIILNPLFQVAVFVIVFGLILKVSRGMDNFIGFLIIGVIFFGFLSGGLGAGSGLIQNSRSMISSFHFPRASLAFSVTLRNFIDNLIPALVAILLAILTQLDKPIHWTIVFVVPLYILIHLFGLGITLIVARITAFIPDAKSIVALVQRALFFLSGVFFPIERFSAHPLLMDIVLANPIYQFLTALRGCILDGNIPSLTVWLYLVAWTTGLIVFGMVFFWRAETRYSGVK